MLDRDHYRRRWLRALESGYDPADRPRPAPDRAVVAAGRRACCSAWPAASSGARCSSLPFFGAAGRRLAGAGPPLGRGPPPVVAGILGDLGWLILSFVLTIVFYLATWTGWFVTDTGYFRHYREANGLSEPPILGALLNLCTTTTRRTTSTAA